MQGCLALHKGSLFVGHFEKTAHVRVFDLDGRALAGGFSFRDEEVGRASVTGLAVDDDRRVWVADPAGRRVRVFTLFGAEVAAVGDGAAGLERDEDRHGRLGVPTDVDVAGDADEGSLVVASGGSRRHALTWIDMTGAPLASLRPQGDPEGRFDGLAGVARHGRLLFAAERTAGCVQVFRDRDFHFLFRVPSRTGRFAPTAVAPLADGRLVVTSAGTASAVLLLGAGGRLERLLAERGTGAGAVEDPTDVVVEEARADRETRVVVADRDGGRVQVFNLEGRCYGAFEEAQPDVETRADDERADLREGGAAE